MRDGCAFTSRLLPSPLPGIQRKWPAIIGIVAATRKAKKRGSPAPSPLDSRRGLTIVLLAQIKLATVSRRNKSRARARARLRRREEGGEGPIYSRGERKDALICISKSNAVRDRPDFYTSAGVRSLPDDAPAAYYRRMHRFLLFKK